MGALLGSGGASSLLLSQLILRTNIYIFLLLYPNTFLSIILEIKATNDTQIHILFKIYLLIEKPLVQHRHYCTKNLLIPMVMESHISDTSPEKTMLKYCLVILEHVHCLGQTVHSVVLGQITSNLVRHSFYYSNTKPHINTKIGRPTSGWVRLIYKKKGKNRHWSPF